MQKLEPIGVRTFSKPVTVLSVSPLHEDHERLEQLLPGWRIRRASTTSHAGQLLRDHSFTLLVCERDVSPASWKDLLAEVFSIPRPPLFIVTAALPDDYLWAEALNLGAYDVLSKPFERAEVIRTLNMAWLQWKYQYASESPLLQKAAADTIECVSARSLPG